MNMNEYQDAAQLTSPAGHDRLLNGALGLCGESGEVADLVKKYIFQGHDLDRKKIADELGDVFWYLAEAAAGLGYNLETIADNNINKLLRRYPEGFDANRSRVRREEE